MHIEIDECDFDVGTEYQALVDASKNSGAQVLFVGRVRDFSENQSIEKLVLSHYPGMTEKVIERICKEASQRWKLLSIRVLHRVGELKAGDQIVMVGVSSEHRVDAFAGAEFIMDALKTEATFWKKEQFRDGEERWLDMKETDQKKAAQWDKGESE
jgi:molybdopterin synthase catalytic subunit